MKRGQLLLQQLMLAAGLGEILGLGGIFHHSELCSVVTAATALQHVCDAASSLCEVKWRVNPTAILALCLCLIPCSKDGSESHLN